MAVTFDAVSQGAVSPATSLTISHTVGSGSDRALWVFCQNNSSGNPLATATCSYNGTDMGAAVGSITNGLNHTLYVWRMVNPPTGTANIVITPSASAYLQGYGVSQSGVDQTTPHGTIETFASSSAATPRSEAVTVASGGMAIDAISDKSTNNDLAPVGSQTRNGTMLANAFSSLHSSRLADATAMAWTWASGTRNIVQLVVPVNPSAGGDTTAPVLTSPTGAATGTTTATVGATTDEANGTLYAVVTTGATGPSVAQIKAGQDSTGAAAAWGGSAAVSSTGANTINATGLTASTAYYAHLVHSDAAANDSNVVTSAQFTTDASNPAPSFDGPNIDNITAKRGQTLTSLDVSGLFSDTDAPTFSLLGTVPTGVDIDVDTGIITLAPTDSPAVYSGLQVRATDTAAQTADSNTFSITVQQCVLPFNVAGMEFGEVVGDYTSTQVDAAADFVVQAYAVAASLGTALFTSGALTTGAGGLLADLGDDALLYSVDYDVVVTRQSDNRKVTTRMAAQ